MATGDDVTGAPDAPGGPVRGRRARPDVPTIYDVARVAGVNPSTVSRALNRPGRLNAATEARVRAAADELGFRFNPMARALPTGRTSTIALVVADLTNPMVFGVVRGAQQAAAAAGFTLVFAESQESGEAEATAIDRLVPSVDGLVLAATRLETDRIEAIARRTPVVLINRDVPGVPSVLPDVASGAEQVVGHLHATGHRDVAYLPGPATSWTGERRWAELHAAAGRRAMTIVRLAAAAPTIDGGRSALAGLVATGATAVVAFNDLMAIGLLQAAAAAGVAVPGGLSVVGFDDIFGAELLTPPLTTVRAPLDLAGRRAVHLLLTRLGIEGSALEAEDEEAPALAPTATPVPPASATPGGHDEAVGPAALLPTTLVVRGTTGPPG